MEAKKLVMNNQIPRDFDLLDPETRQLALAIGGRKVNGTNFHLGHLAKNLKRSEVAVWAARRVIRSEAIGINWEHLLDDIVETCLKEFHYETYRHLKRMHGIMAEELKYLQHHQPAQMDDRGIKEFREMEHFPLGEEEQAQMKWASSFHDICRMSYKVSYWKKKGKFTPLQRKQLDFHARNFFFLGQLFNVYQEVIALSVLHHYPNKGYPDNGIIAKLTPFLAQPKFQYMLNWLVTNDVYTGATDDRGYRDQPYTHEQAIGQTMPTELGPVGMAWVPFIEAIKQPGDKVVCPA